MTVPRHARRCALLIVSAAGLLVSACATPAKPGAAPAKQDPSYGRMAPIPNPVADAPRRPAARPAEATPSRAAPVVRPSPAPAPKPAAQAGRDPDKARALRVQGLEQLNRGNIDRAVDLLRQALRFDPGNALIQRDLDRANRIGQAVRAKP
jgi:hypothetical protein